MIGVLDRYYNFSRVDSSYSQSDFLIRELCPPGGSAISEDGDAGSLRVECSSSDGDDEDVFRLRFNTNRSENSYEYPATSSSVHAAQQTPSTSTGSVSVNASIKVSSVCFMIVLKVMIDHQ